MKNLILPLVLAFLSATYEAPAQESKIEITHGPILGRLSKSEVGVWVRTARPGKFQVRYGSAADKLDQLSPGAETRLDRDNTGWVHITGLKPATKYYYQVIGSIRKTDVFSNPQTVGGTRWLAFPRPQVIFQYYDGFTGRLLYAETVLAK